MGADDPPPAAEEPLVGMGHQHIQDLLATTMKQIEERKRHTQSLLVSQWLLGYWEEEGGRLLYNVHTLMADTLRACWSVNGSWGTGRRREGGRLL